MKKFEVGKIYYTRSACDYNCIFAIKVISRTNKTIKVIEDRTEKTLRVKVWGEEEIVKPYSTYSMCPIIRASKEMGVTE